MLASDPTFTTAPPLTTASFSARRARCRGHTAIQGKPLPPTKVSGATFVPVRPARNGSGKPKK